MHHVGTQRIAENGAEIGQHRLGGILDAHGNRERIVRDPHGAAGDRGGAADVVLLLDHKHREALDGAGQRRRHAAGPGAGDDDVVGVGDGRHVPGSRG